MEQEISLRIVLEAPTANVDFGLQRGRGSEYETVQTHTSNGDDIAFEFSIRVKDGPGGEHVLGGPFVQGPTSGRFIYIDIGTYAGQLESHWGRRLKVPLTGISKAVVNRLLSDDQLILETRVPGKGRDGSPSCATVKPFAGWSIARKASK